VNNTSKKHSRNFGFHYDNIKCHSFNLSSFKIVIIIIIIIIIHSSACCEGICGGGDTAQLNHQVSATLSSVKCASGHIE
jgi:hypothetical protein